MSRRLGPGRTGLSGLALADVLERLEAGKCGHTAVMEWLRIDSYHELVATMHFNGRMMPGHRKMIIMPETFEVFSQLPKRNLEPQAPKAPGPRHPRRTRDVA